MKSILLIPSVVIGCVGIVAVAMWVLGFRFDVMDPIAAVAVTAAAATIAILPIVRTRQADAVTIVQRALVGTVLHLLCTAVFAVVLIAAHVASFRGSFVSWLLGAYWVSLVVLVWQLRRVMLAMTDSLKVQN